jgi:hypothetical protein
VIDGQAPVHDDRDAGGDELPGRLRVLDAELHPHQPGPDGQQVVEQGRDGG